ncbi:hypothetical protein [Nostocoides veronense]|uniref:Secreted protein n=1 Tax=Nostocoides veronense TaxID=330836 RepID=A0ABP4XSS3_9MICO
MTQIATQPAAPAPPQQGLAGGTAAQRRALARRHYFTGTPGRMRIASAVAAALCVAFALAGFLGLRGVDGAVDRASANTEQVVRVRAIYADLLAADAAVTNGFLKGGQERAENRKTYDDAMQRVATNIAAAASAQPADGKALAVLNAEVQAYAGNVDRARTYNREAKPVGAQYLRIAGTELRAEGLPIANAIAEANQTRADQELKLSGYSGLVVGVGVLTLGVLAAIAIWLARRTHRYLNVPLSAALLLVATALAMSISHIAQVSSTMNKVADGDYRAAVSLAQARAAAYDAKANESLTLIARGSGAAYEKAYDASVALASQQLDDLLQADPAQNNLRRTFAAYTDTHQAIRTADDGGDWNEAVDLATTPDTETASSNGAFRAFSTAADGVLDAKLKSIVAAFDRIGGGLLPLLVGLGAALAALLAGRAMSKRIEEFR